MALTKTQQSLIVKARTASASELGVALDDETCSFLAAVVAHDLVLIDQLGYLANELPQSLPSFFSALPLAELRLSGVPFQPFIEKLIEVKVDADTYFYCLATLHKARLKYERILKAQAFPTIDQVGPRGLLQFGTLSPTALGAFLFWRKWLFDIDNRAGQETGYIFEPIIAYAIGGVPYSAQKSPVKRGGVGAKGRQVDCIRDREAYEIKLRVTVAASGQGRWGEELEFPADCQASGYKPILIVLDPTPSSKLNELEQAFISAGGQAYIGDAAWSHFATIAGSTMARFLEIYVHQPIQELLKGVPESLPELILKVHQNTLIISVGGELLTIDRTTVKEIPSADVVLPEDVDEGLT